MSAPVRFSIASFLRPARHFVRCGAVPRPAKKQPAAPPLHSLHHYVAPYGRPCLAQKTGYRLAAILKSLRRCAWGGCGVWPRGVFAVFCSLALLGWALVLVPPLVLVARVLWRLWLAWRWGVVLVVRGPVWCRPHPWRPRVCPAPRGSRLALARSASRARRASWPVLRRPW